MSIYLVRKEEKMSDELKRALEVSIKEAERGEVTHYESLEDLKREVG